MLGDQQRLRWSTHQREKKRTPTTIQIESRRTLVELRCSDQSLEQVALKCSVRRVLVSRKLSNQRYTKTKRALVLLLIESQIKVRIHH